MDANQHWTVYPLKVELKKSVFLAGVEFQSNVLFFGGGSESRRAMYVFHEDSELVANLNELQWIQYEFVL